MLIGRPGFRVRTAHVHYRSVARLNQQLITWLPHLPRDIDLVVGIPRSGLLVANLLALHVNANMTDVDGLLAGRCLRAGDRKADIDLSRPRNVLVVDDSVYSGAQLVAARERIARSELPHRIRYAAPYVAPGAEDKVDLFYEIVPLPRFFEWNLMHHHLLASSCIDIDGVLCRDPSDEENDDGPAYEHFLRSVRPMVIPQAPVGWLVTCRLEKYRALTEHWLTRHGVAYRELVMMDLPDKASRVGRGCHAEYKAHVFETTGADLFIESSRLQAARIAELTGKSVFCFDSREMVTPGAEAEPPDLGEIVSCKRRSFDEGAELSWRERTDVALSQILEQVPVGGSCALIDNGRLGIPLRFAGRLVQPFPERGGRWEGKPADDAAAIRELDRQREDLGIEFLVFAWPAFWWLDHYTELGRRVRTRFACVVETDSVLVFDLRRGAG